VISWLLIAGVVSGAGGEPPPPPTPEPGSSGAAGFYGHAREVDADKLERTRRALGLDPATYLPEDEDEAIALILLMG
jgi:hypothetical protein